jgi:hypothetical protein
MVRPAHANLKAHKLEFPVRIIIGHHWDFEWMTRVEEWIDINATGYYNLSISNEGSQKALEFSFSEARDALLFKLFFHG